MHARVLEDHHFGNGHVHASCQQTFGQFQSEFFSIYSSFLDGHHHHFNKFRMPELPHADIDRSIKVGGFSPFCPACKLRTGSFKSPFSHRQDEPTFLRL